MSKIISDVLPMEDQIITLLQMSDKIAIHWFSLKTTKHATTESIDLVLTEYLTDKEAEFIYDFFNFRDHDVTRTKQFSQPGAYYLNGVNHFWLHREKVDKSYIKIWEYNYNGEIIKINLFDPSGYKDKFSSIRI